MKDTAIEEIRARRRELFKSKYHGSVEQMVAAAMATDRRHPTVVASAPTRHVRERVSVIGR